MEGMGSDVLSHEYDITGAETVIGKEDVSYVDRLQ